MTAVQNEDTIPATETEVASQSTESEEPSATPQAEEKPTEEGSNNAEQDKPTEDTFNLRYNHEDIRVNRDEAVRLAQIGMHLEKLGKGYNEDIKSIMTDLDYFATLQNKSIKDVVSDMINGIENSYREELIEELGEGNPLIEEMLELRKSKNKKAYEEAQNQKSVKEQQAAEAAEQALTAKLATQFEEVRKLFPEYTTVADVPDAVYKEALKSGDLEKEILRFKLAEEKAVKDATKTEEKNKNANVGSVNTGGDVQSSLVSEMMRGIWGS